MATRDELGAGRISRFLQKWTGIKGTVRSTLGSEMVPTISLQTGAENRLLESWHLFAVSDNLAAGGAGNISVGRIRNPPGSGVVAVIQSIILCSQLASDQVALSYGASVAQQNDLATLSTPIMLDARNAAQGSVCIVSKKNNSVTTVTEQVIRQWQQAVVTPWEMLMNGVEVPLLPGSHYDFDAVTANTGFLFSLTWRERALEDSEKSA